MTIFEIIQSLGRPVAYGYHSKDPALPYFCLMGAGQDHADADTTYYIRQDRTQIEYYFKKKNVAFEQLIEETLLEHGCRYEKSEDIYVEDQDVFLIYYDV